MNQGKLLLESRAANQRSRAYGLQRRDVAGDKRPLLLDDGVIDRGAKAFVEDFYAEEFGAGGGAVLVGAGQGDIEGQGLIGIPGKSGFLSSLFITARRAFLGPSHPWGLTSRGGSFIV